MAREDLQVVLSLQAGQYKREAREAATATGRISKEADGATTSTGRLSGGLGRMGAAAKAAAIGGLAIAAAAAAKFALDAVKSAARLEQAAGGVAAVFGPGSPAFKAITDFGPKAAVSAGLSEAAFYEAATSIGNSLINAGVPIEEVADKTIFLTQTAADMAATFGGPVDEALGAIQASLRGEFDPIERFTGGMSQAVVVAKALELGLIGTASELDNQAKTQATLAVITERTAAAQGQFGREADTASGKAAILTAKFENMKSRVGEGLLPVAVDLLEAIEDLAPAAELAAEGFAQMVRDARPLLWTLGQMADLLETVSGNSGDVTEETEDLTRSVTGLSVFSRIHPLVDVLTAAYQRNALAAAQLTEHEEGLNRAAENTPDHLNSILTPAENAAEVVRIYGTRMQTSARATWDQVAALQALADEYLAQVSPTFRALSAMNNYQEKLKEVNEDGKTTAAEVFELAEARAQVVAAFAETGSDEDVAAAFQTVAELAELSTEEIEQFAEELGFVTGREWSIDLLFNFRGQQRGRALREEILDDLLFGEQTVTSGVEGRAHGGPVSAGVPYVVGEHGREMFIPSQSGHVATAQQTRAMGGDNYYINVTVPLKNMDDFARESAREIESVLARRGRGAA